MMRSIESLVVRYLKKIIQNIPKKANEPCHLIRPRTYINICKQIVRSLGHKKGFIKKMKQ